MKYFKTREFDSPDKPGSGELMSIDLLNKLDDIRQELGKPIKITSGYRTKEHNLKVGGKSTSSHIKGLAVDIACTNSRYRDELLRLIRKHEINRVGIAKTFIHIDIDKDKTPNVTWVY